MKTFLHTPLTPAAAGELKGKLWQKPLNFRLLTKECQLIISLYSQLTNNHKPITISTKEKMFTRSTEYAIRAVVYLAQNTSDENRVGIKTIASDLGFPEHYLAKVLQHLVKRKIIHSAKGPNGGFYATPQTPDVTLLKIVDANEGLGFFEKCGLGLHECNDEKPCPIHKDYQIFRGDFYKILSDKTINNIMEDISQGIAFMSLEL